MMKKKIEKSLEKIKSVAKIRYTDGTMHSILTEFAENKYMTDFNSIIIWVFEIANKYSRKYN